VVAGHPSGARVSVATSAARLERISGSTDGEALGWYAPRYGALEPITTLRATSRAQLPRCFATVILDGPGTPTVNVHVSREEGVGPPGAIVGVDTPDWADTLYLEWPREASVDPEPRAVRRTGGMATDARLFAVREMAGTDEVEICLVDASVAVRESDGTPLFRSPVPRAHAHERLRGLAHLEGRAGAAPQPALGTGVGG
jgi:hypothetical protein